MGKKKCSTCPRPTRCGNCNKLICDQTSNGSCFVNEHYIGKNTRTCIKCKAGYKKKEKGRIGGQKYIRRNGEILKFLEHS